MGCDCSGDFPKWSIDDVNDVPQQGNGYNCGVFTCMFALLLSVDRHLFIINSFIDKSAGTGFFCKVLEKDWGIFLNEYSIYICTNI